MDNPRPSPSSGQPGGSDAEGQGTAREREPVDQLFSQVYAELRRLAGSYSRRRGSAHTLQPTALVHEAYLRLAAHGPAEWTEKRRFFPVAARAMRQILIDNARRRATTKRGRGQLPLSLDESIDSAAVHDDYLVALDDALKRLAEVDERQARVVELRFFGGLTIEETAAVLGVGHATIERDWKVAKAWLHREISNGLPG